MQNVGIICDYEIIIDANIHRFYIPGDKAGSKNGWYVLHELDHDLFVGSFGSWKFGIKEKWCSRDYGHVTPQERQTIAETYTKIEYEINKKQAAAKQKAVFILSQVKEQPHAYLINKGIQQHGLVYKNCLIVPIYNSNEELVNLQFIAENGAKRFLTGGRVKDCYYAIGDLKNKIYICEGIATGLSIYEATRCRVIVAFCANNLLPVAMTTKSKYVNQEIIICSDNDQWTTSNTGLSKAKEAAKAVSAKLAVPQFKNTVTKPTDFNDLAQLEGLEEVAYQLDNADYVKDDEDKKNKPTQAEKLLKLIERIDLFCDKQSIAYVTFNNQGHYETWAVTSSRFQDWLSARYWQEYHKVPNKSALQDALNVISGKARFDNNIQSVYTRIANKDDVIYIDLANEDWEIIEVTPNGWNIVKDSPIKFKRTKNMLPLPIPEKGGDITGIWEFLNIPVQSQKLILAFLLECFRPNTPFVILILHGLQGSAKSITQKLLRSFIDPSACNLRSAPKKSEDLLIAAANNWLVSIDNVSHLSANEQDDLCRLATGGGYGTRTLFTTDDETLIDIKRPVIMNGVDNFITAQDLIDRCIIVELPIITNNTRRTEAEIYKEFNQQYPMFFNALLDLLTATLKELPKVNLPSKPRMADFATLGTALERSQNWESGSFLNEYETNLKDNVLAAMEHSPVMLAIIKFMQLRQCYEGTYAELYGILNEYKPAMCGWPQSSKGLASQIKRHIYALRLVDLIVKFSGRRKEGYYIHIYKVENNVH
jgi:phage/plasmid primase-like uncharacterized protein